MRVEALGSVVAVPSNAPYLQTKLIFEYNPWNHVKRRWPRSPKVGIPLSRSRTLSLGSAEALLPCATTDNQTRRIGALPLGKPRLPHGIEDAIRLGRGRGVRRRGAVSSSVAWDPLYDLPENAKKKQGWWSQVAPHLPVSWRSQELLVRILGTLFLTAMCRIGEYVRVPNLGVPHTGIREGMSSAAEAGGRVFGMGDGRTNMYALGIGPRVNASWTIALINFFKWPHQIYSKILRYREEGRSGANKLKVMAQCFGVCFAVLMAHNVCWKARPADLLDANVFGFKFLGWAAGKMLTLVTGCAVLDFIANQVEVWGLGDGTSLIICASILSGYQRALWHAVRAVQAHAPPAWQVGLALGACLCLVYATVYIIQLEVRLPLVYFRERSTGQAAKPDDDLELRIGGVKASRDPTSYLPMKLLPAGMSPLLLASFMFSVLQGVLCFIPFIGLPLAQFLYGPRMYIATYGLIVFGMELLNFNGEVLPKEMAHWMQTVGTGLEGVVPGEDTEEYLAGLLRRMKAAGGALVALLAVAASLVDLLCAQHLGASFGADSLLLITGFITTSQRQVDALTQMPRVDEALQQQQRFLRNLSVPAPVA